MKSLLRSFLCDTNPTLIQAKSSVAYGLMQLVPKSDARDAYLKVFKRDKIVRPTYLYDLKTYNWGSLFEYSQSNF